MAGQSLDKVAHDLSADFAALREDLRKLTSVVADLADEQVDDTRDSLGGTVDRAKERLADTADRARRRFGRTADRLAIQTGATSERVRGAGAELEADIGRNALAAIAIAAAVGLLVAVLSRARR
jgi:ElaB/YqjD/DUF883 family membrane-anchored ribosome-binding protein